jgi:hypothetical protein
MKKSKTYQHWTSAVKPAVTLRKLANYPKKLKAVVGDPRLRGGTFYESLGTVVSRYPKSGNLTGSEARVFSQNGEDGIIAEIVRRVGNDFHHSFVEFGAGNGRAGNCLILADVLSWPGLFIEPAVVDFDYLISKYEYTNRVRVLNDFVNPTNIDSLVRSAGMDRLGVLSIDIDGNDFYVWKAMEIRADLVIIEYNGSLNLSSELTQPLSDLPWDGTCFFGSSLGALVSLGKSKGYTLIHTELTGTNAFFVADEHMHAFEDLVDVPRRMVNYELLGFHHGPDRQNRSYLPISNI